MEENSKDLQERRLKREEAIRKFRQEQARKKAEEEALKENFKQKIQNRLHIVIFIIAYMLSCIGLAEGDLFNMGIFEGIGLVIGTFTIGMFFQMFPAVAVALFLYGVTSCIIDIFNVDNMKKAVSITLVILLILIGVVLAFLIYVGFLPYIPPVAGVY